MSTIRSTWPIEATDRLQAFDVLLARADDDEDEDEDRDEDEDDEDDDENEDGDDGYSE
jgi:hypothetical protein